MLFSPDIKPVSQLLLREQVGCGQPQVQQCYEHSLHQREHHAGIQKILDALSQNKIESLQEQVSELKIQQMFCDIPRISPYGYGVVPQFATNPCSCCATF